MRIIAVLLIVLSLSCEGRLECELCGRAHDTDSHLTTATERGGIDDPQIVASDQLLLEFIKHRREEGFTMVNESPYPSEVSDQFINVFVSNFALGEYLDTTPNDSMSEGMLPRGAFIVRELIDENGEVASITALYRGPEGYNPIANDHWYAVSRSDGTMETGPLVSCSGCHAGREDADYLFGVPTDVRAEWLQTPTPSISESFETTIELRNVENDTSAERRSVFAVEVSKGSNIVLARNATRDEFENHWGKLPSSTLFINSKSTDQETAVNGGETWVLKTGTNSDGPTAPGRAGFSYARNEAGQWNESSAIRATPGMVDISLPSGTWITEWSDAPDYKFEFIEFAVR